MQMGLTETIAEVAESKETLDPFIPRQSAEAAKDRRIYGKKLTQAFS